MRTQYIAYYRVSTSQQGRSGLGLEGQKDCIQASTQDGDLIAEFTEVESGAKRNRVELDKALDLAKNTGATLIIAKLDRLARNVSFIFSLRDAGIKFQACDCPDFNTLTLGIFASFAQYERERISDRTRIALDVKRKREGEWRVSNLTGEARVKAVATLKRNALTNPNNTRARAFLKACEGQDLTLQAKADLLNESGYVTSKGKQFTRMQVSRLS